MNEFYLDGNLVDLSPDTNIGVTLQVNDIAEMKDRNGYFSNTFKTPETQTNKAIYEHAEIVTSTTSKPYRKLSAKFVQDGVELVPAGYAEVKSAGGFYEQTIFSGILDFFSQIKGKSLKDLDLSAYDHTWDLATVFGSRLNTEGFIYPVIDYSDDEFAINNTVRQVDARYMYVAMFVSTLIDAIVAQTNYSIAGDVLITDKYRKRLFPFQLNELLYDNNFISAQLFKARMNHKPDKTYSITIPVGATSASVIVDTVPFNDDTSQGFFDNPGTFDTLFPGIFTVPVSGRYKFTSTFNFSITHTNINTAGLSHTGNVYIRKFLDPGFITGANFFSTLTFPTNETVTVTTPFVQLNAGERIVVSFDMSPNFVSIAPPNGTYTVAVHNTTTFENAMDNQIVFGGPIFMNGMMPDMKQEDLIKTIAHQFGIVFVPDNINKVIYFKQFSELYANKAAGVYIDMTDKLDVKSEVKVTFRESKYGQKNWFRYKEDNENLVSGIGDGYFVIDDENLQQEVDIVTLPFAGTEDVERLIGLGVVRIPKQTGGVFKHKTQPRIVMLNSATVSGGDVVYTDGTSTLQSSSDIPLTYFIDAAFTDSLGFGQFLLTSEYNEFINFMMNRYKKIEAKFHLSVKDVHTYAPFVPWYMSYDGGNYFYVNVIKSFVKGKLTSVELIRM